MCYWSWPGRQLLRNSSRSLPSSLPKSGKPSRADCTSASRWTSTSRSTSAVTSSSAASWAPTVSAARSPSQRPWRWVALFASRCGTPPPPTMISRSRSPGSARRTVRWAARCCFPATGGARPCSRVPITTCWQCAPGSTPPVWLGSSRPARSARSRAGTTCTGSPHRSWYSAQALHEWRREQSAWRRGTELGAGNDADVGLVSEHTVDPDLKVNDLFVDRSSEIDRYGRCPVVDRQETVLGTESVGMHDQASYDGERVFVITGCGVPADLVVSRQLVMSLVANRHQAASPKTIA